MLRRGGAAEDASRRRGISTATAVRQQSGAVVVGEDSEARREVEDDGVNEEMNGFAGEMGV